MALDWDTVNSVSRLPLTLNKPATDSYHIISLPYSFTINFAKQGSCLTDFAKSFSTQDNFEHSQKQQTYANILASVSIINISKFQISCNFHRAKLGINIYCIFYLQKAC